MKPHTIRARGFVLSEDDEADARILADAMRGIGRLVAGDDAEQYIPAISSSEVGAIFLVFAEDFDRILNRAEFHQAGIDEPKPEANPSQDQCE